MAVIAGVIASCALGLANVLPHLHEPVWQDEAVTLMFHATKGILGPFLSYGAPNNHLGFSAMLAAWLHLFPGGVDVPTLRALPVALFLLSIPVTAIIGMRVAGPTAGIVASLVLATSTVAGNFATQLRGYGPSWLFMALALLFAIQAVGARAGRWSLALYCFFAVAAIAVLPTNLFLLEVQTLAAIALGCMRDGMPGRDRLIRFAGLLAVLPLGLLVVYSAVWRELLAFNHVGLSAWTRTGLVQAWLSGALWSAPWLAPLAGAGLSSRIGRLRDSAFDRRSVAALFFCGVLIAGFGIAIFAFPGPPFPRSLVPFLPAWSLALGILIAYAVEQVADRRNLYWMAGGLLLFSLPLLAHPSISRCGDHRPDPNGTRYDLCNQYFRDDYHPEQVLVAWAAFGREDLPIVSGYEGFYALRVLGSTAPVYQYESLPAPLRGLPLVVAHDNEEARVILAALGLRTESYGLAADTGYFNVYAPKRR